MTYRVWAVDQRLELIHLFLYQAPASSGSIPSFSLNGGSAKEADTISPLYFFRRSVAGFFTDHAEDEGEHLPRLDVEHMGELVVQPLLRVLHQPLVRRRHLPVALL